MLDLKFCIVKRIVFVHENNLLQLSFSATLTMYVLCGKWYYQNLKNRLQTTQNKRIRFVFDLDSQAHIGPEQSIKLNWLPVQSRVEQIMLCHVHKINNNSAPEYMKQHVLSHTSLHSYNTRLSTKGG